MDKPDTDKDLSGHVERTNDRDYEVEERYRISRQINGSWADNWTGDIELWSQLQTDSRKKRKVTWIP
jgi:hypothetical protein